MRIIYDRKLMNVLFDYNQCKKDENTVLTVGTFDGIHLGHQLIIKTLIERARERSCRSCLITFKPHPQLVLRKKGKEAIHILTPLVEKIDILKTLHIDQLVVIAFTKEFSKMSAKQFVENVLIEKIGLKEIVVGYDHAFGKDRAGTLENLKLLSKKWNFNVSIVPPLIEEGEPVNSTRIRRLITEGNVEHAGRFLGRPYKLSGIVVRGFGRGRMMNYPTANVRLENTDKLVVADGLYICEVEIHNRVYEGMLSVGYRPTFPEQKYAIEVHIINFNKNIYGESLNIKILKFLREQIKFNSTEDLISQMNRDYNETLSFFSETKKLLQEVK